MATGKAAAMYLLDSTAMRHDMLHACRARLHNGVDLDLRPVRVSNVLRALQTAAASARSMSVGLEIDETVHVAADEALLTWAIGELLHNALAFSRAGAHLLLRCRAEDLGVSIEVEDECGGLPPNHTARLFVPADGVEHGLPTARQAVEAMGGELYVENHPGHGCIFTLLFPPAHPGRTPSFPQSSGCAAKTDFVATPQRAATTPNGHRRLRQR
jgi:signal transduction histidine kinase